MVAPAKSSPTPPPQKTRVDIYEVDRKRKLEEGINPIKIDTLRIPYVKFVDARARAAQDAAEARMGRKASSVRHSTEDNVNVLFNKGAV